MGAGEEGGGSALSPIRHGDGSGLAALLPGYNRPRASGQVSMGTWRIMSVCVWGGCPCAAGTVLDFQWPGQESLSFPWPLQALILETSRPGNSGRMHGGLGIYKYLQIFLVLVDVMEFEDVRVLDELQDGYLPLHLGKRNGGRSALPPSLSPAPKGPLSPNAQTHLHQHRLRQLLPVHDLDGHLLARDAVDPEFNQT